VYLGHLVSPEGILPDNTKINAIKLMLPPVDLKGLRRFLGLTSYYRKFIQNFSKIAEPLNKLLKKSSVYHWDTKCDEAFDKLKEKLVTAPILAYPDYTKEMIIYTDASNIGLGAILSQEIPDKGEQVIMYASRTLNAAEKNYATTELECLAIIWAVEQFRPYIYGRPFKVVTDHSALRWIMKNPTNNAKLTRWALKLQDLDMTVLFRQGKQHNNVDALSRKDANQVIRIITDKLDPILEKVKESQRLDSELKPMIDYLEHKIIPEDQTTRETIVGEAIAYELIDGILCRTFRHTLKIGNDQYEPRIVIPKRMREEMLHAFHDSLIGGHLGIKKTYEKLAHKYYWKGLYNDVKMWISTCVDCSMKKGVQNKKVGNILDVPARKPWEIMGMDIIGPLPITRKGNRYILVFTEHFTKWVEAFPLSRIDSETIAKFFVEEVCFRHGFPDKLLSDRGRQLIGEVMTEVTKLLGIKQKTTTAYHPQTNGLTERFNKTLIVMLSMYVSKQQNDWDEYIPYVIFAYNTAIHPSTNAVPFELVRGFPARLPMDLPQLTPEKEESMTLDEYKSMITRKYDEIKEKIGYQNEKIKQKMDRLKNIDREPVLYKSGDLVWLYYDVVPVGKVKKLSQPWKGPYRITEIKNGVNAVISEVNGKNIMTVHVSRLKKFVNPRRPKDTPTLDEPIGEDIESQSEEETEYEVEFIKKDRFTERGQEYLVKWKGYTEPSWETEKNLSNSQDLIKEYWILNSLECSICGFQAKSKKGLTQHKKRDHDSDLSQTDNNN
jgi:hypothetical protein